MINNDDGKITVRYDTAENWENANPILDKGELVITVGNDNIPRLKCGDGVKRYTEIDYVNKKIKPYCAVYQSKGGDQSQSDTVIFNSVISNVGNCYNTSTGYFTCSVDGIYAISFNCFSNNTNNSQRVWIAFGNQSIQINGAYAKTMSMTVHCNKGDKIRVYSSPTFAFTMYSANAHNLFTVALLAED